MFAAHEVLVGRWAWDGGSALSHGFIWSQGMLGLPQCRVSSSHHWLPSTTRSEGSRGIVPGPPHPLASPPPPAGCFLLESLLFWVRPGHESIPEPRSRPAPGAGCAAAIAFLSATAFLSPLPPARPRSGRRRSPPRRGWPCPLAAGTRLFPFVSAGVWPWEGLVLA